MSEAKNARLSSVKGASAPLRRHTWAPHAPACPCPGPSSLAISTSLIPSYAYQGSIDICTPQFWIYDHNGTAHKPDQDACQEGHPHLEKELVDGYVRQALPLRLFSLRCAVLSVNS